MRGLTIGCKSQGQPIDWRMSYSVDRHLQTRALAKAGFDRVLKMQAGKSYKRYKDALHLSFNRLLCNPKKTCNDVKPHHVAKLLENMTASMVRAYNGRCQKPESSSHGTEFAQHGQVSNHTHKKHKKAAQKAKS
ncbi:tetA [Symbiodinium natans]|uniref:TetA protein n=1 Tax=Symbiodinium natans TaxID=878477 RepID=A0A812IGR9_9DINO|nr:tetA [Symbiodinium natans]